MVSSPDAIDVHHHVAPQKYVSALADIGVTDVGTRPFPEWNLDTTLSLMDRYGIRKAIASISAPGVYFGDRMLARKLARMCNEFFASLIRDHPERFGAYAVLPLPDVDGALQEMEYALDTLKLDGLSLLSNVRGRYLGDPEYNELFDELNRRRAVVFIHPDSPPENTGMVTTLPPDPLVEYVFDTTRAVCNLLFSGTLERCQDIRIILPHAGGTIPFVALRLCLGQFWPGLQENVPKGIIWYLQRLYYDTAISAAPFALRSLQALVDPSHILFATDYPFGTELAVQATIEGLRNYDGFDQETLDAVFRGNALEMFSGTAPGLL